jgi:hypothetical protein
VTAAGPTGWRAAFPPAQWLPAYRGQWLAGDAVAGVTVAAYAIPASLANASLAGLPPQIQHLLLRRGPALRAVRLVAPARRRSHVGDLHHARRESPSWARHVAAPSRIDLDVHLNTFWSKSTLF